MWFFRVSCPSVALKPQAGTLASWTHPETMVRITLGDIYVNYICTSYTSIPLSFTTSCSSLFFHLILLSLYSFSLSLLTFFLLTSSFPSSPTPFPSPIALAIVINNSFPAQSKKSGCLKGPKPFTRSGSDSEESNLINGKIHD